MNTTEAPKSQEPTPLLGLGSSAVLGVPTMHPPLPTPAAWNCYWKGDNDSTSWDQWHDASDPMPERWDSDPPDDVVPYFTSTQVFEYAGQCVKDSTTECSAHWQAKTEVLARWMAEALGALCDVDGDAEDGGESLRMLKDRGQRLVRAVLASTPNVAIKRAPA